eukprot:TRINITY_DN9821_c3_g1_i1.p1 TRINITY_DN9821_c3_g1~~TRINITY_DN9821_c3_g1_i1.p1  ORF type:complete len:1005 (+),score=281.15 TRINITY_DN9821_c3_g1_i1:169-3183(+)
MPSPERRGIVVAEATGAPELLVLRRGALRVYRSESARHVGLPVNTVHLCGGCQVRPYRENGFELETRVPYECTYAFRAPSTAEAQCWREDLEAAIRDETARMEGYLRCLEEGSRLSKYHYSNSKRMRRHFWVESQTAELCWARSRTEEPQTMDLKQSCGLVYGALTTTFQRCEATDETPRHCMSLLFQDRTLDLAAPTDEITEQWFLGLQHLLLLRARSCSVLGPDPAQFVFRKVYNRLREGAQAKQLTVRTLLLQDLRALAKDTAFRETLRQLRGNGAALANGNGAVASASASAAAAEDADAAARAAAKEERRRKRRETRGEAPSASPSASVSGHSFSPPPRESSSRLKASKDKGEKDGVDGAPLDAAEEEQLRQDVAGLERQLEDKTTALENLRAQWEACLGDKLPLDALGEALRRSSDGVCWQAEKCGELEREALTLRCANQRLDRQLASNEKAEKQLKKLAKQFKESEASVQQLEQDLASVQAGAQSSESAKFSSTAALERSEVETSHLERRVVELQEQLQQAQRGQEMSAVYAEKSKKQVSELARIEKESAEMEQQLQKVASEVKSLEARRAENERRLGASAGASRRLTDTLRRLQQDAGSLHAVQKQVKSDCQAQLRSISDSFVPLGGAITKVGAAMTHLSQKYVEIQEEKKKLHNLVLELKGNIRVFVRVRPINEREKQAEPSDHQTISFAEETKIGVFEEQTARKKWFDFDRVFSPKTLQPEVFEEVKPLATSVLDGYNVCIFAYGQTGSGKTFTMTGNEQNPGLNVRVLTELFRIREARKVDTKISITMQITEIYNETIKDLFVTKQKKLDVKTNPDGSNTVPGLTEIAVDSVEDVLKAMKEAQSNRTVMATDMNEESSRSHSIVQVKTSCYVNKTKREYHGKINLIDLAGSENVNKSGVSGQGMREAQNINKSLSALGDVVQALIAKSPHVPYRNSKLTMMLKDSLGGDAKTLMIVQSSPAQCNVTETLSSLNFASRARNVELGRAKRNSTVKD